MPAHPTHLSDRARGNALKSEATALLAAEGLDWTSPAADIADTLTAGGWGDRQVEKAIDGWLR